MKTHEPAISAFRDDEGSVSRRRFLRGLGGVTVGLPLLDVFTPRRARAAAAPPPVYATFVVEMNGFQQAGYNNEPERFWPSKTGALSKTSLAADTDRATSVFADYGDQMLFLRGISFKFPGNGCGHSGGGNQVLTAAQVSMDPAGNKSLAMGESVDYHIEHATTGREPLGLYAGPKYGYINDHISFRGPKDLIIAENDPWVAYSKIVGMSNLDAATQQKIAGRRKSVNDLIRGEMQGLLGRTDLSSDDRSRLNMHFQSIRDIEVQISTSLPDANVASMKALDGQQGTDDNRLAVEKLQFDIMAFALSGGYARTAFLQMGDGTDGISYTVDGTKLPNFHHISHRIDSDGATGTPIANSDVMHHQIDLIRAGQWKYLLDQLAARTTPDGTLLDVGFHVWTNQIATGGHSYDNVPYLVAGKARGFLKTGQFLDLPKTYNNQLLATFINAAGVRQSNGDMVTAFGDPSLTPGLVGSIIA